MGGRLSIYSPSETLLELGAEAVERLPVADMTISDVCDRIGVAPSDLAGNCHAISTMIVESGICGPNARVARGYYDGCVGQHSWVTFEDGDGYAVIVDATLNGVTGDPAPRLVISREPECRIDFAVPCMLCGCLPEEHPQHFDVEPCEDYFPEESIPFLYDEAGDNAREATRRPMPAPSGRVVELDFGDDEPFIWSTRPEWTVVEVGWLCSSGSHVVGGQDALRRIVEAVCAAGLKALVPVAVPAFCGAGVG